MFAKICLEGAVNWSLKANTRILMVVPVNKAIPDTLLRLGNIISNPDRNSEKVLAYQSIDSCSIPFSNGSVICVATEESVVEIGQSWDIIYVHPWCESDSEDLSVVLSKDGIIF